MYQTCSSLTRNTIKGFRIFRIVFLSADPAVQRSQEIVAEQEWDSVQQMCPQPDDLTIYDVKVHVLAFEVFLIFICHPSWEYII